MFLYDIDSVGLNITTYTDDGFCEIWRGLLIWSSSLHTWYVFLTWIVAYHLFLLEEAV